MELQSRNNLRNRSIDIANHQSPGWMKTSVLQQFRIKLDVHILVTLFMKIICGIKVWIFNWRLSIVKDMLDDTFLCKINVWTISFARATPFSFDGRMDVREKESIIFRQNNVWPHRRLNPQCLNPQRSDSCRMLNLFDLPGAYIF